MDIKMHIACKLDDFTLEIDWDSKEKRLGILGASGCGKSMTLKALAGIITPTSGTIVMNGETYFDSEKKINIPPQKRNVGYLFQNYALFPTMTVEKNIEMGIHEKSRKAKAEQVNTILERFQLQTLRNRYPHELSGGQQQRVALARMMAYEPALILLDEPFSALDSYLKDHMMKQLNEILNEYDGTVIMVSHSRDEIYAFTDYLFIMSQGKMIEQNSTEALFRKPQFLESAKLTGCKNISAIKRIDDDTCLAQDWGITFRVDKPIHENIKYIGFRAHDVKTAQKNDLNAFPVRFLSRTKTPFECVDYFEPYGEMHTTVGKEICMKYPKHLSQRDSREHRKIYLAVSTEDLLLLK